MLTRRSLLASTAAGLAAPLAAPVVIDRASAATPKNVVVMAKQIDDIIAFDPAEVYEFSNTEVNANCYRRLVRPDLDAAYKIAPDLAEKWTISPDGKSYTFKLGKGSTFESGKPVTAADVVFSLERVVKLNKTPGFILTQFGLTADNVNSLITAPDEQTVEIKLPQAFASSFFMYCLSANVGSVVDKATVMANATNGDFGNGWLKTRSAGSGGYKLTSWQASDHVILDANPHASVKPNIARVIIKHVNDPAVQLLQLQKGDADIARNLGADQLKTLNGNKDVTLSSSAQGSVMYIAMNQAMPELAKPQVHQAIKWAVNYEAIAKNITPGTWSVGQSFLTDALPGALKQIAFKQDVAKAKQLMSEAGLGGGFAVTMDYISQSPYTEIAQAVQADLAAIGIKVTLQPGEQKQVITKTRARQHQLAMLVWGTDYFDPNSNSQAFCENPDDSDQSKLKILAWRSHFVDKQLTAQSVAAAHELDAAKRIELYHTMQREFMERAPFAILMQQTQVAALGKGVSGFRVGPSSDFMYYGNIRKA
ncbi:MAG: ABC transporter substrate-binding protein [Proteobacteria bacterium]|nr:ABC transporter substrate-binding protein [Pseudomonadota bacterium]